VSCSTAGFEEEPVWWAAWRLEKTSRPLADLENRRNTLGESVEETEISATGDNDSVKDTISWGADGGEDCLSSCCWEEMVKKVPCEDPPSFSDVRERAANSILDINPGNRCCPLYFFKTAKGISSISSHLRLGGGGDTGRGNPGGKELVVEDLVYVVESNRVSCLTYGWKRDSRGEWRTNFWDEEGGKEEATVGGGAGKDMGPGGRISGEGEDW